VGGTGESGEKTKKNASRIYEAGKKAGDPQRTGAALQIGVKGRPSEKKKKRKSGSHVRSQEWDRKTRNSRKREGGGSSPTHSTPKKKLKWGEPWGGTGSFTKKGNLVGEGPKATYSPNWGGKRHLSLKKRPNQTTPTRRDSVKKSENSATVRGTKKKGQGKETVWALKTSGGKDWAKKKKRERVKTSVCFRGSEPIIIMHGKRSFQTTVQL